MKRDLKNEIYFWDEVQQIHMEQRHGNEQQDIWDLKTEKIVFFKGGNILIILIEIPVLSR